MAQPDAPTSTGAGLLFPEHLVFRPIFAMPYHSSHKSMTVPAPAVQKLPVADQLHTIARSADLWEKLKNYARVVKHCIETRTHDMPEEMRPDVDRPFPTPEQQEEALACGKDWFSFHARRSKKGAGVTCELAIQDEIVFNLSSPFECAFQMRYRNPAHEAEDVMDQDAHQPAQTLEDDQALGNEENFEDIPDLEDEQAVAQRSWLDHKSTVLRSAPDICLPALTRPVSAMHIGNLEDNNEDKDKPNEAKSGYPDKVLVWGPTPDSSCLLIEAKTFWSLQDKVMYSLVSRRAAKPGTGAFTWNVAFDTEETMVLKQIWGECHFFNIDFGVFTNGSTLRVFVRTAKNQLCFSDVKNWRDPDVLLALLGLGFISLDHPKGHNQKIKDYLCDPVNDRRCDWPADPEDSEELGEPEGTPPLSDSESEAHSDYMPNTTTGKGKKPLQDGNQVQPPISEAIPTRKTRSVSRAARLRAQVTNTTPDTAVQAGANLDSDDANATGTDVGILDTNAETTTMDNSRKTGKKAIGKAAAKRNTRVTATTGNASTRVTRQGAARGSGTMTTDRNPGKTASAAANTRVDDKTSGVGIPATTDNVVGKSSGKAIAKTNGNPTTRKTAAKPTAAKPRKATSKVPEEIPSKAKVGKTAAKIPKASSSKTQAVPSKRSG